jgi:putative FmdB family regulatory protein
MPLYEYYCSACASKFELLRPMRDGDLPATCPSGHKGGARTLSMVAPLSKAAPSAAYDAPATGGGCGCGGGGCGCRG